VGNPNYFEKESFTMFSTLVGLGALRNTSGGISDILIQVAYNGIMTIIILGKKSLKFYFEGAVLSY